MAKLKAPKIGKGGLAVLGVSVATILGAGIYALTRPKKTSAATTTTPGTGSDDTATTGSTGNDNTASGTTTDTTDTTGTTGTTGAVGSGVMTQKEYAATLAATIAADQAKITAMQNNAVTNHMDNYTAEGIAAIQVEIALFKVLIAKGFTPFSNSYDVNTAVANDAAYKAALAVLKAAQAAVSQQDKDEQTLPAWQYFNKYMQYGSASYYVPVGKKAVEDSSGNITLVDDPTHVSNYPMPTTSTGAGSLPYAGAAEGALINNNGNWWMFTTLNGLYPGGKWFAVINGQVIPSLVAEIPTTSTGTTNSSGTGVIPPVNTKSNLPALPAGWYIFDGMIYNQGGVPMDVDTGQYSSSGSQVSVPGGTPDTGYVVPTSGGSSSTGGNASGTNQVPFVIQVSETPKSTSTSSSSATPGYTLVGYDEYGAPIYVSS